MNASAISKNYAALTPHERFRLIIAAGGRGDEAEQERLCNAAQRLTLTMPDHSPWCHAFHELAITVFLELLEEAAKHHDAFERWSEAREDCRRDEQSNESVTATDEARGHRVHEEIADNPDGCMHATSETPTESGHQESATRARDLYLAQGFILKTKMAGWKTFCERLSIPPYALWQFLPGFTRLQWSMELLEDNEFRRAPAFRPKGMVRWLARSRPEGEPAPTIDNLISATSFAKDLAKLFRNRAKWWGG